MKAWVSPNILEPPSYIMHEFMVRRFQTHPTKEVFHICPAGQAALMNSREGGGGGNREAPFSDSASFYPPTITKPVG